MPFPSLMQEMTIIVELSRNRYSSLTKPHFDQLLNRIGYIFITTHEFTISMFISPKINKNRSKAYISKISLSFLLYGKQKKRKVRKNKLRFKCSKFNHRHHWGFLDELVRKQHQKHSSIQKILGLTTLSSAIVGFSFIILRMTNLMRASRRPS